MIFVTMDTISPYAGGMFLHTGRHQGHVHNDPSTQGDVPGGSGRGLSADLCSPYIGGCSTRQRLLPR